MSNNPFWVIVKELYPLFLKACALMAVWRFAGGIWDKLNGDDEGIGEAINDIIVSFFFGHMGLPIVMAIWHIMKDVGDKTETVFKTLF